MLIPILILILFSLIYANEQFKQVRLRKYKTTRYKINYNKLPRYNRFINNRKLPNHKGYIKSRKHMSNNISNVMSNDIGNVMSSYIN